jgi:hypothetical protein
VATNLEKTLARKLLAIHREPDPDPDKACRDFEALALKLAKLCVGTKP